MSGKNGLVGEGSVGNGSVAKKVAADPPSFNWFVTLFAFLTFPSLHFLGANKRLYKRLCPSVDPLIRGSVDPLVRWSVARSVGRSLYCFAPGELATGLSFSLVSSCPSLLFQ
jgi:hypothetical protein